MVGNVRIRDKKNKKSPTWLYGTLWLAICGYESRTQVLIMIATWLDSRQRKMYDYINNIMKFEISLKL